MTGIQASTKQGLVERMIMQIVSHMMLEVMLYLRDKETSTYCKSQKKLTAMVSLLKIRMPDNHESIYFVNTYYIIADTTGERWFKFPTYCWLCWVSVGAESFEVFNVHDDAAISVFGRSVFVSKFCQGVHFRLTKHESTSYGKMTILEILWSWSSKPADDIFEILRLKLIDPSKEKSMNHNPKWLKIKMQPNIQTFYFLFF